MNLLKVERPFEAAEIEVDAHEESLPQVRSASRFTTAGLGRRLRYIPEGGALVEVTCRTIHSRFLLRPSPELNDIVVGVLGRAQRLYEVRSNHFHLLPAFPAGSFPPALPFVGG